MEKEFIFKNVHLGNLFNVFLLCRSVRITFNFAKAEGFLLMTFWKTCCSSLLAKVEAGLVCLNQHFVSMSFMHTHRSLFPFYFISLSTIWSSGHRCYFDSHDAPILIITNAVLTWGASNKAKGKCNNAIK